MKQVMSIPSAVQLFKAVKSCPYTRINEHDLRVAEVIITTFAERFQMTKIPHHEADIAYSKVINDLQEGFDSVTYKKIQGYESICPQLARNLKVAIFLSTQVPDDEKSSEESLEASAERT